MRAFACVPLLVSSALAYQVTFPDGTQGQNWNTTGPNSLEWQRVTTDPLNFTVLLTNVANTNEEVLSSLVDGTLSSISLPAPSGGFPAGSGFRVDLAQDATHLNSLLAQSNQFNITSSSPTPTQTGSPTGTATGSSTSSSDTSTTPTGTSAASLGADARLDWLAAAGALTVLVTTLF